MDSKHTPHVLYIYQHVMFTMQYMQMFNLVLKSIWWKLCSHFIIPIEETDLFL